MNNLTRAPIATVEAERMQETRGSPNEDGRSVGDRSQLELQEKIQVFLLMVTKISKSFLENFLSPFYS